LKEDWDGKTLMLGGKEFQIVGEGTLKAKVNVTRVVPMDCAKSSKRWSDVSEWPDMIVERFG